MKFLNMTQHLIRLITEDDDIILLEPCGIVVRAVPKFGDTEIGSVDGVKIISTSFQDEAGQLSVVGLDTENLREDTIYIVSTIAAQVIRKPNVVSPATIDEWVIRFTDKLSESKIYGKKSPESTHWSACKGQVFGVRALQCFC